MAKRSTGRRSASGTRAAAPRGGGGTGAKVSIICSDCLEDYSYRVGTGGDEIVCPVCEHSCNIADRAPFDRLVANQGKERRSFAVAMLLTILFVGGWFGFLFFMRDTSLTSESDPARFWGTLGTSLIALFAMFVFGGSYEKNRWEGYF